ncbi:MAG: D-glycero-beta-D-manno-heptose-7-phosphate kinase [Acidobacteriota bacterium]
MGSRFDDIIERVSATRTLVIGDVMLDRYWWGDASRLSPEAPVPVVALQSVSHIPGGAANVAANIAGLGAKVLLAGVIGTDASAASLRRSIKELGISDEYLISSNDRPTTTKTRVLVNKHQIARVDEETNLPISTVEEDALIDSAIGSLGEVDAVVLSDYAKGCLTDRVVASVIKAANASHKPVLVDPKGRDFRKYAGVSILTPNFAEALNAAGIEKGDFRDVDQAAVVIMSSLDVDSLLITLGEHGMKLFHKNGEPTYFPSVARQVFDVTGAGDTVAALLATALGTGANKSTAAEFANIGAGISVEKVGTSIVALAELSRAIDVYGSHLP